MKNANSVDEVKMTLNKVYGGAYKVEFLDNGRETQLAWNEKYVVRVRRGGRWFWSWSGVLVDSLDDLALTVCEFGIERVIVEYN